MAANIPYEYEELKRRKRKGEPNKRTQREIQAENWEKEHCPIIWFWLGFWRR